MTKQIKLEKLVGKHTLTSVDFSNENIKVEYSDEFALSSVINFTLDGKTYTAIEDPSDGYRSSLRSLHVTRKKPKNTFAPVEVLCIYRIDEGYHESDILEFYDIANGKIVLKVGTNRSDDYYPSFVARWVPENLSINNKKKIKKV